MNVHHVIINWSESPVIEGENIRLTLDEANKLLRDASRCKQGNIGYDKTSVTVVFDDGHEFRTRIDLYRPTEAHYTSPDIMAAVRREVEFLTGNHRPSHLSQDDYAKYVEMVEQRKPGVKEEARMFLSKYLSQAVAA